MSQYKKDFAPPLRRRDPFSPYFGYRKKIQRDRRLLVGLALAIFFVFWHLLSSRGTYAVLVDGKPSVYLDGKKDAQASLRQLEQFTAGKGKFRETLTIQRAEGKHPTVTPEKAVALLKKRLHLLVSAYLFQSSGKTLFAVENKEEFLQFLNNFKKSYCARIISPPFGAAYIQSTLLKPTIILSDRVRSLEEIENRFFQFQHPSLTVSCRKKQKTTEDTPFQTEIVKDPALYSDTRYVRQEGVAGKKEVSALLEYENGKLVQKKILSEKVVLDPIKKIVVVGTRRKPRG